METTIKVSILVSFFLLLGFISNTKAVDTNLAKLRTVTHSSSGDANHCGHLVVDGSPETYWESGPGGKPWIKIDLGASQKFNQIVIHWGENFGVEYKVTLFENEAVKGEEIYNANVGSGGNVVIDCFNKTARFVRIDVMQVKDPIRGCVINEVAVMGEGKKRFVPSKAVQLTANDLTLNGNMWRVQSAMFVPDKPQDICNMNYNDSEWIPAEVPGTVMNSYYNFEALPDPLYGDNMHQISDEFFSGNDFWYRTSVRFPAQVSGKRIFLNFSGINWKSEIYFNGQYLGRIDGAFKRAEFEVSKLVRQLEANTVVVLVHHPDNWILSPHKVVRKYIGARTTNGDMLGLDSPACLAATGWNWLPIVKGRNIGIWNDVTFRVSGNVSINDPWVSTILPGLPDTTKAEITIRTELKNHEPAEVEGKLIAKFGKTVIELPVKLNANETKTVVLDQSQFAQLELKNPKLWWPNGYGQQNLLKLNLQFVENGKVSDNKTISFGIRQLDHKVVDNILFFYCNGVRLLLRGGNWGLPEALMRCDSNGYNLRVKLHREANLNMIRNWVGMTGHEAFYDACDRFGILIFDDFWLANPVDGPDPKDFDMFMDNVRDKIKWVRKHPSLALYCGRNEGIPLLKFDTAIKNETEMLDGTRHYIPHSAAGTVTGLGPYDVRDPRWYFKNRGTTFHTELGIIAFPEVESMRRMMPEDKLWPINNMWAIHDYQWGRSEKFTDTIATRFGEPAGIDDYCRRAQLQNYESAKAIFECLQSNQGSGVLLWMSQAAWPSVICQLYDHYFEYTASYFAIKKAASPVHVFWDIVKNEVRVANNTAKSLSALTVKAAIYDLDGKKLWEKSVPLELHSARVKTGMSLDHFNDGKLKFLKLELTKKGKLLVDNFYWMENKTGNCLDLNNLPIVNPDIKITSTIKNGMVHAMVTLTNNASGVALLNKIKVKKNTSESILPVFFNDNYVSLLPGESKSINFEFDATIAGNDPIELWVEGWNAETRKMILETNK